MAEIVLAVLLVGVGLLCGFGTIVVLWANAIGGVTNATAVNNWPALTLSLAALASLGGGIFMLLF